MKSCARVCVFIIADGCVDIVYRVHLIIFESLRVWIPHKHVVCLISTKDPRIWDLHLVTIIL